MHNSRDILLMGPPAPLFQRWDADACRRHMRLVSTSYGVSLGVFKLNHYLYFSAWLLYPVAVYAQPAVVRITLGNWRRRLWCFLEPLPCH